MNVDGELYPHGSQHHPNERRLQMTRADLLAMPAAFADFNGFHGRYEQFVITNPIHMLWALAITALAVVALLSWRVGRVLRRRSQTPGRAGGTPRRAECPRPHGHRPPHPPPRRGGAG